MPQSADETAEKGNDLKEESDVIDLTEEVPAADSSPEAPESSPDEQSDPVTREVRVSDRDVSEDAKQALDEDSEEIIELRETVETARAADVESTVPSAAIFRRRDGSSSQNDGGEDLAGDAEPPPEVLRAAQAERDVEANDPDDDEPIDEDPAVDQTTDSEPTELDEPVEEEIVYDRQAMVKTIQMSAIDRREFERQVKAEEIGESVVLNDHSHAPDVLVVPPRVLTTRWKEGGPLLRAGVVELPTKEVVEEVEALQIGDESPGASDTLDASDTMDAPEQGEASEPDAPAEAVDIEPADIEPADVEPQQAEPEELEPGDIEPAEQHIDQKELDDDVPEIDPDVVELELDSEAIEDTETKPPPKPRAAPAHGPNKSNKSNKPKDVAPGPAKPEDAELSGLVQELLDENKKKPKKKVRKPSSPRDTWFKNVFTEEYLRTLPRGIHRQTKRDVDFIAKSFGLGDDDRVLDLACGFGRHSIELTKRGYEVAGLDLSMPLLQKALNEAKKQSLSIKFIHGDMRELSFDAIFSACFLWQTSFGFFDDQTNFRVLRGIHRSLRPGGKLLI
ncbi:MAG: methyltransferase domain-containing protein, partial [Persicimonas sp.]